MLWDEPITDESSKEGDEKLLYELRSLRIFNSVTLKAKLHKIWHSLTYSTDSKVRTYTINTLTCNEFA